MSSDQLPRYNRHSSFKRTQPPNPEWDLGQGIPKGGFISKKWKADLKKGWKTWKLDELPNRYCIIHLAVSYRLLLRFHL